MTYLSEIIRDEAAVFLALMRRRMPGGTPNWSWFGLVTILGIALGFYPSVESRSISISTFITLMAMVAVLAIVVIVLGRQTSSELRSTQSVRTFYLKLGFVVVSLFFLAPVFIGMLIGMPIGQFIIP